MDKTKKYTYLVPGLEIYRLESKKEVEAKIEELASLRRGIIDREFIKGLYINHKIRAQRNVHFCRLVKEVESLHKLNPKSKHYAILRKRFINYTIIHKYYSYVYFDFPEFNLTQDYISEILSIQSEYVDICSKIIDLYDYFDFSHIVMPQDQSDIDYEERNEELSKKWSGKGWVSVRLQYEIKLEIEKEYKKEKEYPKHTPEHYMKMVTLDKLSLADSSIYALKNIVRYHLQTQDLAKKLHNASYIKLAKKRVRRKSNFDRILEWINDHPGNIRKVECAKDLGINRSTVYRNWPAPKK